MLSNSNQFRLVPVTDPRVAIMGRMAMADHKMVRIGFPGVTLRIAFTGTRLGIRAACSSPNCRVLTVIDGKAQATVKLPATESEVSLAAHLPPGEHLVDVVRLNEHWQGAISIVGLLLARDGQLLEPKAFPNRRLLFIGDSVTSGEGVDRSTGEQVTSGNAYLSFGMRLGRALEAQCHLVSYGGRGLVRDWQGNRTPLTAPRFFELAIPDEAADAVWDHGRYVPDGIFISLGTNDFNLSLGDFPRREEYVDAYLRFLTRLRSVHPLAQIFLTEGAIVVDAKRAQKQLLRSYIEETTERMKDQRLHVLWSKHYPGDSSDVHPTEEQHAAMAGDFAPEMREILGW